MAKETTNLKLKKPDGQDSADIDVINQDLDMLDSVISDIDSSIDGIIQVSETQPTNESNKLWIVQGQDLPENQVPTVAQMNDALNSKVDKSSIVNDLTSTSEGYVLDARQGKVLQDGKLNKSDVVDALNSTDAAKALSAKQGKALASRLDEFSTDTGRPKEYTGNIDNINVTSSYYVRNASGTFPSGVSKYGYLQTYKSWYDNTERKQIYMPYDTDNIYTRTCNNQGTWSAWTKIVTENVGNVALTNVNTNITIRTEYSRVYRNGRMIYGTVIFTTKTSIGRSTTLFKLPVPLVAYNVFSLFDYESENAHQGGIWVTSNGNANYYCSTALSANRPYIFTFSYLEA